jgi:hypothetical protein
VTTESLPTTQDTQTAMSRRDLWLTIALAIARDGLPEPVDLSVHDDYHFVYLRLSRHADTHPWAQWFGIADNHRTYDREDLGSRHVRYNGLRHGWSVEVSADEPIPTAGGDADLAAQVVEAIGHADAAAILQEAGI